MDYSSAGNVEATEPKLTRRERENLRQRDDIFEAALRLFSERGYHNVSMSQIAGEAEFGIGTLYKFFDNKENLYKALIMEMVQKCHGMIINSLRSSSDPLSAIRNYIAARHRNFVSELPLMRLYFAEATGASFNLKAGLDKDLVRLYDGLIEELASVFEKGIEAKLFRDVDPYNMALALEGALNSVMWRLIDDPEQLKDSSHVSMVADLFFRGVLDSGACAAYCQDKCQLRSSE